MKTFSAKKTPGPALVLNQHIVFAQDRPRRGQEIAYTIDRELARGGEGIVYTIRENKGLVAKIFHHPSQEKAEKLNAMLADVPRDPTREQFQHISLAWPVACITNVQGECLGFLMPHIDQKDSMPLLQLYNPRERKSTGRNFTWEYLLRMVENLAGIIKELHRKGYVIGDLNESNILVNKRALVTLVDCDSIQVPKPRTVWQRLFPWKREYFHCVVGKPEYTPPELQGRDFRLVNRTANHDNFSLAVLIFLMLMEGWHPFSAIWKAESEAPPLEQRIRKGIFPYVGSHKRLRPIYAPPLIILPGELQRLMARCFRSRHKPPRVLRFFLKRPSAATWFRALKKAESHLAYCQKNPSHVYSNALPECPWCQRVALGIPDSFPPAIVQKKYALPPGQQKPAKARPRQQTLRQRLVVLVPLLLLLGLCGGEAYAYSIFSVWFWQTPLLIRLVITIVFLALPLLLFILLAGRTVTSPQET